MTPDFCQARFLKSCAQLADLPADRGREIAFAGRSNAGKSSALNAISGVSGLARVGKLPGRTRLINLFGIGTTGLRLVDLPGYGYAKAPEVERRRWGELVADYFRTRRALAGVVLIMDVSHPLGDLDRQMLDFAAPLGRPVHVLLSKADKLGRAASARSLAVVRRQLGLGVGVQLFSSLSGEGVEAARCILGAWLTKDTANHRPETGDGAD